MTYSRKGNAVFMATIAAGATLSTVGIAVFGLTAVSLSGVLLLTVASIIVGTKLEAMVEEREEESFYSQFEKDDE